MSTLLDASALLNIVRALGEGSLEYLRGSYILTLTPYEVGNAIWKEATLHRRLTVGEAVELLGVITGIYRYTRITEPRDQAAVLRLACELHLTYYDSSYIVAAGELGALLVTDDRRLRRVLEERTETVKGILGTEVKVASSSEYIR